MFFAQLLFIILDTANLAAECKQWMVQLLFLFLPFLSSCFHILCGRSHSCQFRIHNMEPDEHGETRAYHPLIFGLLLSSRGYAHNNLVAEALYLIDPCAGPLCIPL
ncbi:unnamed protein product [Urochloa decumbens]|uniref:Secreted protein n=1 Tax=Urochloa decumbens TaxID=240449 RepID=A0ABC8WQB5_9POAL